MPAQNSSNEARGFIREFISWADFDTSSEVPALWRLVSLRLCAFLESPRAIAYGLVNYVCCKLANFERIFAFTSSGGGNLFQNGSGFPFGKNFHPKSEGHT